MCDKQQSQALPPGRPPSLLGLSNKFQDQDTRVIVIRTILIQVVCWAVLENKILFQLFFKIGLFLKHHFKF